MITPAAPHRLGNAFQIAAQGSDQNGRGALWHLAEDRRDLDTNIVRIAAQDSIGPHDGPDLDVMVLVLAGTGELASSTGLPVPLSPGELVWLPRHAPRHFVAGSTGLTYLTVHCRRPGLSITHPASDNIRRLR